MKGNLFTSYYSQLENQITEAYMKVMMHSTPELTDRFLDFIGIQGDYGAYMYDFQFGNDIQMDIKRAVLVGIAESGDVLTVQTRIEQEEEQEVEQEGIPDGYLYANRGAIALLFEMKRGGGRLYRSQLDAHKRRFTGMDKDRVEEIILTWKQVLDFFKEQRLAYPVEHRNHLLIEGFVSFCELHFVGENTASVSPERIVARYDTNGCLKALHDYAAALSGNPPRTMRDSMDYHAEKPFFTIWHGRGYLILKPQEMAGLYLDLLVAKQFGRNCFTPFDNKTQETFIRIDWIQTPEQLEQVKSMISLAYASKVRRQTLKARHFITNHGITSGNFALTRLGREDRSFFGSKVPKVEALREEMLLALQG
jgi:hypothetical protein